MGADTVVANIRRYAIGSKMQPSADAIMKKCQIYCANNPKIQRKLQMRKVERGIAPGKNWQVDFSELPKCGQYKYLLVLADTFSGWPEAFPCHNNQAREVVKILSKEIIPGLGSRFIL